MKLVALFLPEVSARIEENDFGIVHLEIGAMKLATKYAFTRSDFATVRKHLFLIADLFETPLTTAPIPFPQHKPAPKQTDSKISNNR